MADGKMRGESKKGRLLRGGESLSLEGEENEERRKVQEHIDIHILERKP